MNFMINDKIITKNISSFRVSGDGSIIIFFESYITANIQFIEFTSDDFYGEITPFIKNILPKIKIK